MAQRLFIESEMELAVYKTALNGFTCLRAITHANDYRPISSAFV